MQRMLTRSSGVEPAPAQRKTPVTALGRLIGPGPGPGAKEMEPGIRNALGAWKGAREPKPTAPKVDGMGCQSA